MTATAALLEELRLLRAMGEGGRAAAAKALRSARLGLITENPGPQAGAAASTVTLTVTQETASEASTPTEDDDPMKLMTRRLDAAIVKGGGKSIYGCKPHGDMSSRAQKRLARWAFATPRVHPDAGGPKTGKEGVFQGPRFASDREDER